MIESSLKINLVEFVKGIVGTDAILNDGHPHFAFVGRSNAGKSSVLNVLVGRNIAKSSSTPGKTKEINFFLINNSFYFVDLPGYGFAKVSPFEQEKIRKRIIWYLVESGARPLKIVVVLDVKVGVTQLDREMFSILEAEKYEVIVIANKVDKLNQKETIKQLRNIKEELNNYTFSHLLIPFSSISKEGKEEALRAVMGGV